MLDTMENFYIYKEKRINDHINEKCTVKPSVVFDTLILEDTEGSAHDSVTTCSFVHLSHDFWAHADAHKNIVLHI